MEKKDREEAIEMVVKATDLSREDVEAILTEPCTFVNIYNDIFVDIKAVQRYGQKLRETGSCGPSFFDESSVPLVNAQKAIAGLERRITSLQGDLDRALDPKTRQRYERIDRMLGDVDFNIELIAERLEYVQHRLKNWDTED